MQHQTWDFGDSKIRLINCVETYKLDLLFILFSGEELEWKKKKDRQVRTSNGEPWVGMPQGWLREQLSLGAATLFININLCV